MLVVLCEYLGRKSVHLNLQTSFKQEGGHFHKAAVLQTNTTLLLSVFYILTIAIAHSKVRFKFDD